MKTYLSKEFLLKIFYEDCSSDTSDKWELQILHTNHVADKKYLFVDVMDFQNEPLSRKYNFICLKKTPWLARKKNTSRMNSLLMVCNSIL